MNTAYLILLLSGYGLITLFAALILVGMLDARNTRSILDNTNLTWQSRVTETFTQPEQHEASEMTENKYTIYHVHEITIEGHPRRRNPGVYHASIDDAVQDWIELTKDPTSPGSMPTLSVSSQYFISRKLGTMPGSAPTAEELADHMNLTAGETWIE